MNAALITVAATVLGSVVLAMRRPDLIFHASRWLRAQWRPALTARHMRVRGSIDLPYTQTTIPRRITTSRPPWEPVPLMAEPPVRDRLDRMVAEFTAPRPTPNQAMNLWSPHDTAVDASLFAAIRAEVDGIEHMHQYVDRLFSQVNAHQIVDDAFRPLLRRLAVSA